MQKNMADAVGKLMKEIQDKTTPKKLNIVQRNNIIKKNLTRNFIKNTEIKRIMTSPPSP